MPSTKIKNEQEAIDWLEEGRTYAWIVEQYKIKYGIDTTVAMWSAFRRRRGIPTRVTRDTDLIPWRVQKKHIMAYPLAMLRAEARRRAGEELKGRTASKLESWKAALTRDERVVYYDPDTEDGFFYVPREERDSDLIRKPATGLRPPSDD
ncbi:hypothetical protein ACWDR0_10310 [Streptomyces sp. NPDC003691]